MWRDVFQNKNNILGDTLANDSIQRLPGLHFSCEACDVTNPSRQASFYLRVWLVRKCSEQSDVLFRKGGRYGGVV